MQTGWAMLPIQFAFWLCNPNCCHPQYSTLVPQTATQPAMRPAQLAISQTALPNHFWMIEPLPCPPCPLEENLTARRGHVDLSIIDEAMCLTVAIVSGAVPRTHEILAAQPDMHWDRGKTEGLLRGRNFPVGIVEARDVIRRYKDLAGLHQRKKVRNGRFVAFVYV